MTYRALVSRPGCHVVYLLDDFGRLLAMWAATSPAGFDTPAARLVAALTCDEELPKVDGSGYARTGEGGDWPTITKRWPEDA